ncbi:MAG: response regulator transcription factor [Salinivirgaceae bacterium]|nr:response regulator transcription factor [Salinivirgaceae bacterium]
MKVAIIDDESNGRNIIRQYLSLYCQDVEVIGEADSVKSGVKLLSKQTPDVVFLDIQMQDGTGFNLLELLPQRTFKVIFVTSFDQFALKAIKFSVADYLLKPVDPDAFVEAVEKVRADITQPSPHKDARIEELLTNINSFAKIGLPTNDGIQFVKVDDIVRCEADGAYTQVIMDGGTRIMVSKNLKVYEELFADRKFLRVHKSHLINIRYIDKYLNSGGDGGSVVMADGSTVEVSRRKKEELLGMMM